MALAAAAGGWERQAVERSTAALPGLLTSIALHGAVLALLIAGLHRGMNGAPAESAPAFVSLVPAIPAAEPVPEPLPPWGLRKAAPEPVQEAADAPDPLMEETALPEMTSEMANLPPAVFEAPTETEEEDAAAIAPAKPMPAPASVKVRKAHAEPAQAAKPIAKAVGKPKPKPTAKPDAARPTMKPVAKPVDAAPPVGDPSAKPHAATSSAASTAAPTHASGAATASTSPVSAPVSDAPVLVTDPNYAGACPIRYPDRARRRNQEGTVLIHALIGTDGKPIEVTVASSSGHDLLDAAAREAIADCAFVPQLFRGRDVKAIVEIPIPFKLI